MRVFKNLFGKGDKIHSDEIYLNRVDTLSTPLQITSTVYTNPNVVTLKEPYTQSRIYLVEFYIEDARNSQFAMFTGLDGGSSGFLIVGSYGGATYSISKIKSENNIGFYSVSGGTQPVFVNAIYAIG